MSKTKTTSLIDGILQQNMDRSEQIQVGETFPEIYLKGGIMERGNFSACAGFSSCSGRCAVFGTFAAFQEMILSEASNRAVCSDFDAIRFHKTSRF